MKKREFIKTLIDISGWGAEQGTWERKKRKINQYELDGTFIRGFNSITEAAKDLNISASGISQCLSGKNKKSGGYIWKYTEANELSQSDRGENGFGSTGV